MDNQTLFRETIFALSSGSLPSGVAVIRLSGPQVTDIIATIIGEVPPARKTVLRAIKDRNGQLLDMGLVLFFKGPRSFTGEDAAELHVHGGKATVAAVLADLSTYENARPAEAGEFTRRAFLNGKLDLTSAEALSDLVAAETEQQRQLAISNADGKQRALYDHWRQLLLRSRALIEAELDFADEADVPGSVSDMVWRDVATLKEDVIRHVAGYRSVEIVREGFRVVLIGAPNAGKSSLLNALAKRDVAIVTDIPGTTRDLVEVQLDLKGIKVIVTDTAGVRESDDLVEQIGVERAIKAAERADLILHLQEPGAASVKIEPQPGTTLFRLATKADLVASVDADFAISAKTGFGITGLEAAIANLALAEAKGIEGTVPTRARHVELLNRTILHLDRALTSVRLDLELRAEELRLAERALGKIVGTADTEELLGVIFSEFCIGK
jgi:tRNA modification GTPase